MPITLQSRWPFVFREPVRKSLLIDGAASGVKPKAWGPDPWVSMLIEGRGVPRPFNAPMLRDLATSEWVRLCVDTLVDDVTSVDWTLTSRKEGEKPNVRDVEAATEFLNDMNPNYTSFRETLAMTVADMLEVGNGVWVKSFSRRDKLAQLSAYDAETFFVEPDVHGFVKEFYQYPRSTQTNREYRLPQTFAVGEPIAFRPEEISWFSYSPRTYRTYGFSPVESLHQRLDLLVHTLLQETLYFKEGSISPGLLSLLGDQWTQEKVDAFKAWWEANKGKPHKMQWVAGQAEYVKFGYNYQELQFLDRQKWYQTMVLAVFKIPPTYAGLASDTTNRATDVSQQATYKRKTLRPLLDSIENVVNQTVIWPFVSPKLRFQFKPTLDLSERQTLASIREVELRSGYRTVNEVRTEEGLDPVAWGDEPYPPLSFAADPLGDGGEGDGADPLAGEAGRAQETEEKAAGKPPEEPGAQDGPSPEPAPERPASEA